MDLRQLIDSERMRPIQWVIVAMCVLLNGLDGYDVAAMSFTATRVQDEFGLSGSELGVVISATLIGMAVGYQRARHRPHRVDIKIARRAIKTLGRGVQELFRLHIH